MQWMKKQMKTQLINIRQARKSRLAKSKKEMHFGAKQKQASESPWH